MIFSLEFERSQSGSWTDYFWWAPPCSASRGCAAWSRLRSARRGVWCKRGRSAKTSTRASCAGRCVSRSSRTRTRGRSETSARHVHAKFSKLVDLHSLESDVLGDHIGHDICMHHSRSLTPFPNIQLLLPAWKIYPKTFIFLSVFLMCYKYTWKKFRKHFKEKIHIFQIS